VLIGINAVHAQDLKSSSPGISAIRNYADKMRILPNPATNHMSISVNSNVAEPTKITIYDQ
jgi:hypothetical protein